MHPAAIDVAAAEIGRIGFARLKPSSYQANALCDQHLIRQTMKENLGGDPKPGKRRRAYSVVEIAPEGLCRLATRPYLQSKEYNPDAAGEARSYSDISDDALNSRTLWHLASIASAMASKSLPADFPEPPTIAGIHFISYEPDWSGPSWSLPIWFHIDQERFVALFFVEQSENLLGGQTAIAGEPGSVGHLFQLEEPFEAVFLTKATRHAVVPMASKDDSGAFRRIILVTFD